MPPVFDAKTFFHSALIRFFLLLERFHKDRRGSVSDLLSCELFLLLSRRYKSWRVGIITWPKNFEVGENILAIFGSSQTNSFLSNDWNCNQLCLQLFYRLFHVTWRLFVFQSDISIKVMQNYLVLVLGKLHGVSASWNSLKYYILWLQESCSSWNSLLGKRLAF